MPNHVTTIITFENAEDMNKLIEQTKLCYLDYDVPKWSKDAYNFINKLISFTKIIPEPKDEQGYHDTNVDTMDNHAVNWYQWRIENWGTKWDAYEIKRINDHVISFDTAWSHPFQVIYTIAHNILPTKTLYVKFADEDFGSNLGEYNLTITPNDDQPIINHVWLKSEKISDQDVLNELAAEVLYGKSYAEVKSQWDEEEREFNEKGG